LNADLLFVSGDFLTCDLPNDKQYLYRYFTTDIQRQFVRYFLLFGNYDHFVDHTGYYCQKKWLDLLAKRFHLLEQVRREAKQSFDLTLLAKIESGGYVL